MAYPNILIDLNDNSGLEVLRQQQDEMLEKYSRKHQEEIRATSEGTSGTHVDDEKDNARVLRGFSE